MSHATVMVIGPSNELELSTALAPFDEELEVAPHFSPLGDWVTEKMNEGESLEDFAVRLGKEWEEDISVRDGVIGSMTTYSPDAKWDWYSIGGRWRGSLPLKADASGGHMGDPGVFDNGPMYEGGVDVAKLGDIDFDLKRTNAESRAKATIEQVIEALDGREFPPLPADDADRETYQAWWAHPIVVDVKKALGDAWGMTPQDLIDMLADTDRAVTRAGNDAICCFATLYNGEWIEPGRMGWFGMSSDTPADRDNYAAKVTDLLASLPDDTMIWVVDYHI